MPLMKLFGGSERLSRLHQKSIIRISTSWFHFAPLFTFACSFWASTMTGNRFWKHSRLNEKLTMKLFFSVFRI